MALATLCSKLRQTDEGKELSFRAFIVDHALRRGSDEEARKVAEYLKRLGMLCIIGNLRSPQLLTESTDMPSKIITLDRKQYGDAHASQKIETVARRLRYRAMAMECRGRGIENLLFAHHADDQAETVLMRLANNYLGKGLAGMHREAQIPECEDLYGVHGSGTDRVLDSQIALPKEKPANYVGMLFTSGGIKVIRPLLDFTKDRLVATCEEAGVQWVEDHTNKDRSLTLRNTVRYLHEENLLPVALQRPNLCDIAARTSNRISQLEAAADKLFQDHFRIQFDPRTGHAICEIFRWDADRINSLLAADRLKAELLRKLLLLVAPKQNIDLSTLEAASSHFLEGDPPAGLEHFVAMSVTVAGATVVALKGGLEELVYEVRRTLPPRKEAAQLAVGISLPVRPSDEQVWSEWSLWDGRYWIRIGSGPQDHAETLNVVIRLLAPEDIAALRREMPSKADTLHEHLSSIKGHLRTTLPAIVQILPDGQSRVVALPTLFWSRDKWFTFYPKQEGKGARYFDVRYRHIDDSLTLKSSSTPRDFR